MTDVEMQELTAITSPPQPKHPREVVLELMESGKWDDALRGCNKWMCELTGVKDPDEDCQPPNCKDLPQNGDSKDVCLFKATILLHHERFYEVVTFCGEFLQLFPDYTPLVDPMLSAADSGIMWDKLSSSFKEGKTLPDEGFVTMLSYLEVSELLEFGLCCKKFQKMSSAAPLWTPSLLFKLRGNPLSVQWKHGNKDTVMWDDFAVPVQVRLERVLSSGRKTTKVRINRMPMIVDVDKMMMYPANREAGKWTDEISVIRTDKHIWQYSLGADEEEEAVYDDLPRPICEQLETTYSSGAPLCPLQHFGIANFKEMEIQHEETGKTRQYIRRIPLADVSDDPKAYMLNNLKQLHVGCYRHSKDDSTLLVLRMNGTFTLIITVADLPTTGQKVPLYNQQRVEEGTFLWKKQGTVLHLQPVLCKPYSTIAGQVANNLLRSTFFDVTQSDGVSYPVVTATLDQPQNSSFNKNSFSKKPKAPPPPTFTFGKHKLAKAAFFK
eukprot:TRINITY_DN496_c0_g1_i1.p1 TRINITY_DN496_c0_g1~~TRINITY_DN496_c0_g1_i1.p1  ORF type:complete len:495 (-),score=45.70 TRINITY_DN496_c0_g1_i1:58-1542(-)